MHDLVNIMNLIYQKQHENQSINFVSEISLVISDISGAFHPSKNEI